ncbi:bifunctional 3'-5' exonuclease/DNA polymerase [Saccharomonospora sp. CUA-673]|uniref:bifunctional 3'-5' exonuclease/DNA polymerase n=1 Tax=Saccharomonospora sp. CUA-673 TaxID=1904969 RepID=UPI00095FC1AD|nr:bifunctional 3'-5' exonuclease/DNA polymerase [Saccharomonospora sp. CUA-673]OLT43608.1 bifunctional 3'-5' exonuclease/DNA polymerase [Saccharomonospora sp. CUA-673]
MHVIVARDRAGRFAVRSPDGPAGDPAGDTTGDTVAADGLSAEQVAARAERIEREHAPRWVLPSAERDYRPLLEAGVRVRRCHDLALVEGLLLAAEGRHGQSCSLAAAHARARGLPAPRESAPHAAFDDRPVLFDPRDGGLPDGVEAVDAAAVVLADQLARSAQHDRMRLLVAAESASALAAAEMSADGLPWRAERHAALLTELLGPRVPAGSRPAVLAALVERIDEAFGRPVNPDHPESVVRAFGRAGISVPSARAHVLRRVDHPAVAPLLEYKELARLHSAHGWAWLDQWVRDDRFRPVYVVGGVVSGRWASRGGAALQIPRMLRGCVTADPGWKLVVADAAQLEPRILAALSGDRRLAEVSGATDLYTSLAEELHPGAAAEYRPSAKIAMLSAMYGGTAGEAAPTLAVLRRRFPDAASYVEHAAATGERGEVVRSRLGRTSPPPSEAWRALTGGDGAEDVARRASRDWGRFTRNFVVQASAADWTAVLLATLRRRLPPPAHLVFFQHDEVLVHTPADLADTVVAELGEAVAETTSLVFGPACPVRFPMPASVVDTYAEAK